MSFPSGVELDGVEQYYSETVQRWDLGTRGFMPDGRAYRYVQCEADPASGTAGLGYCVGRGMLSYNPDDEITSAITTAGSRTVTGTNTNNAAANEYAGGILSTYDTTGRYFSSGIVSNTAANNAAITIVMERPALVTSSGNDLSVCASPYHQVVNPDFETRGSDQLYEFVAGVCNAHETRDGTTLAEDHFMWIQTWGTCLCMVANDWEGGNALERMAYFDGAGVCQVFPNGYTRDNYANGQMAGYLMVATSAVPGTTASGTDVTHDQNWIWLMITP